MNGILDWFEDLLGIGKPASSLGYVELSARAVFMYVGALFLVRVGHNRALGKYTAFDVVLGYIFGSMLSRAVNGSSTFAQTLVAAAVMLFVHWLFGMIALRSPGFSKLIRGIPMALVERGEEDSRAMRRALVTPGDLEEALRKQGLDDFSKVQSIHLERDGTLSVVKRERGEPRVVELGIEAGVKKVRIELA